MDTELLRTFLEVASTRHFGRAAGNLYLTQAAVSARIKLLEEQLGQPLFLRSRNNIQLTAAGERLLPHAETVLTAWSRARQEVALQKAQSRQLSLGATTGLWQYLLPDALPALHRALPDVALRAEAHGAQPLLDRVLAGTLDLVVVYDAPATPELAISNLAELELSLVSSERDLTLKEALAGAYVAVDWGTAFGLYHAKRFGEMVPAVLHSTEADVAERFIRQAGGSAWLPERVLEGESGLYPVADAPRYQRATCAVYRRNSERLALITQALSCLSRKVDGAAD